MNTAYACGSGGVIFVPETIEKTMPKVAVNTKNSNDDVEVTEEKKE